MFHHHHVVDAAIAVDFVGKVFAVCQTVAPRFERNALPVGASVLVGGALRAILLVFAVFAFRFAIATRRRGKANAILAAKFAVAAADFVFAIRAVAESVTFPHFGNARTVGIRARNRSVRAAMR